MKFPDWIWEAATPVVGWYAMMLVMKHGVTSWGIIFSLMPDFTIMYNDCAKRRASTCEGLSLRWDGNSVDLRGSDF